MRRTAVIVVLAVLCYPLGLAPATARDGSAGATLGIPATANIFGAGRAAPPAGQGGTGRLPPRYALPAGSSRVLTFTSVTGRVTCCNTVSPPPFNGAPRDSPARRA
jgi:hypothetical protein